MDSPSRYLTHQLILGQGLKVTGLQSAKSQLSGQRELCSIKCPDSS